jgi:protein-disulfide isomerase
VTLVEYSDYAWPYYSAAEVAIREVLADFGDDVRYVWRHLPLNKVHPQRADGRRGGHRRPEGVLADARLLITDPDELDPSDLDEYAEQHGLDRDRFWDDIRRYVHVGGVADDVASADASGVAGTPDVLHQRPPHTGAYDVATLTQAVTAARGRARAALAS